MPAPFGVTVPEVRNLAQSDGGTVPQDGGVRPAGARPPRIPDEQVASWVDAGARRVLARIPGYAGLPAELVEDVEQDAHHLTALYAASLLSDVEHPERIGQGGRLGDALMTRFTSGLSDLTALVAERVAQYAPEDPEGEGQAMDVGAGYTGRQATGWEAQRW